MENLIISGLIFILGTFYFFAKSDLQRVVAYGLIVTLGLIPLVYSGKYFITLIVIISFCVQELTVMNEKRVSQKSKIRKTWNNKINASVISIIFLIYIFSLLDKQKVPKLLLEIKEVDVFIIFLMASTMGLQFARKKLWKL